MTTNAWIFLGASWTVIAVSTLACFAKLLTSSQHLGDGPEDEP